MVVSDVNKRILITIYFKLNTGLLKAHLRIPSHLKGANSFPKKVWLLNS